MIEPYVYRAKVHRVIDGDTLIMDVDLGFRTFTQHSIRLAEIDAPEIFKGDAQTREKGLVAKSYVLNWVTQEQLKAQGTPYKELPFLLLSRKGDSFGRWIGWLFAATELQTAQPNDPETFRFSLNEKLVEAGHAVFWQA